MEVTIWGSRGSVPAASPQTAAFGGNTTCVAISTDAGDHIILDAGTGIRGLGERLRASGARTCTLCLTHAHWDHIQGLPFFAPLHDREWLVRVFGPEGMGGQGVRASLEYVLNGRNFPLLLADTACSLETAEFTPGTSFRAGSALVETCPVNHPGGCVAYRVTADGWSFVFTGDHEWDEEEGTAQTRAALESFITGADVLLADAPYTPEEYGKYRGWGHSCMEDWPEAAARAGVRRLLLTHHAPARTDGELFRLAEGMVRRFSHLPLSVDFAFEGMRVGAPAGKESRPQASGAVENRPETPGAPPSCWLCALSGDLARFTDVGTILDCILNESCRLSGADAGTVYLVEDKELVFAYTRNDTLFPGSAAMRHVYQSSRLPVSTASIAGYAAVTRRCLNIADVRVIPADAPYAFNDAWDKKSGYRTVSMLAVPLVLKRRLLGVLQLINRLGPGRRPVPFSPDNEDGIARLAGMAVTALERGLMANELILRMLEMAALRDPRETGGHVRRVGAMAAEVYHRWAERRETEPQELRRFKGQLRLAAMLHDVGKVGIADAILKKNGPLTEDERRVMERHCSFGGALFANVDWEVDAMAREVALHHHQRWDGKGYAGGEEPLLSGEGIPLAARITSVADVYDALVSRRSYKDAYDGGRALALIRQGAGSQFDPEVVAAFEDIIDVVDAIHERYPDGE